MSEAQSTPIPASPDSAFAPLRQTLFAVLWAATIIGSIGSFVRDVTSAWLVTDLSSSPAAVAMVQAAAALPVFLLAIPAGVLSDMLDRRKLLICVQLLLASVSVCLVILSIIDQHSVTSLIVLTFIGGVGVALMGPTWQAIVPELVDKKDFKNAVDSTRWDQHCPCRRSRFGWAVAGQHGSSVYLWSRRSELCRCHCCADVVETTSNATGCTIRTLPRRFPCRAPLRPRQS